MTLKEFKELTKGFPEDMDIMVNTKDIERDYQYELAQEVSIENLKFYDTTAPELATTRDVIVIETI